LFITSFRLLIGVICRKINKLSDISRHIYKHIVVDTSVLRSLLFTNDKIVVGDCKLKRRQ